MILLFRSRFPNRGTDRNQQQVTVIVNRGSTKTDVSGHCMLPHKRRFYLPNTPHTLAAPGYFALEASINAAGWNINLYTVEYFFCISVTYFDILVLAITNKFFLFKPYLYIKLITISA